MPKTLCPPIERIRQRLSYDADTGRLFWLRVEAVTPHEKQWNSRYAGKEALRTLTSKGYFQGKVDGQKLLAHRVCWALHYGHWPDGQIDHINHIKTDNRIGNIRSVSPSENMMNRPDHVAARLARGATMADYGHYTDSALPGNSEHSENWQSLGRAARRVVLATRTEYLPIEESLIDYRDPCDSWNRGAQ